MSAFSSLINRRSIQKKVDQEVGGSQDFQEVKQRIQSAISTQAVVPSNARQLAGDIALQSKVAGEEIQKIINEVVTTNSDDSVTAAYFGALDVAYFNPALLLEGKSPNTISLPPSSALKIVERGVYTRQTDPRAILVRDLYRTKAQVGAIQYAYERAWDKITTPNNLIEEIPASTLSNLVFAKDSQFVKLALEQARNISTTTVPGLTEGFFDNIGEMIYASTGSLEKLGQQLSHLSNSRVDHLFDEYHVLDESLDATLGNMLDFAFDKVLTAKEASICFGMAPELLKLTDNLEGLGNPINKVPELALFRNELDQRLLQSMRKVEGNLIETEGRLLQSFEVRKAVQDNINKVWVIKDMLSACSIFGELAQLDFSNIDAVVNSLTSAVNRLRGVVALSRKLGPKKPSEKEVFASEILLKWTDQNKI